MDLTDGEAIGKLAVAVGERWGQLDILVLNAAMLGSLTPVQDLDAKEFARDDQPQRAGQPGADRGVRPAAAQIGQGRGGRAHLLGRAPSRAPSGAAMARPRRRSTRCSAPMPTRPRFTGKFRVHIVDPGATRTRMRQLAFPGEEPESLKPPEAVAEAIVARLLSDAATGERLRIDA